MSFFDKNPNLFRILYILIAAGILVISAVSLYRYASSPTDENVFHDSPSTLYVIKHIPGRYLNDPENPNPEVPLDVARSGIQVSDLILTVNGKLMRTPKNIDQFLDSIGDSARFEITVFRPKYTNELTYSVRKYQVPDSSFRIIPASVCVYHVTAGGTSDRAGMQVGDLIYRINFQNFKDAIEAEQILQTQTPDTITYDVLRDNQSISLNITLASVGIRLSVLILVLCGVVYMGTGIFVAIKRPQFTGARMMGWTFLSAGFFMTVLLTLVFQREMIYDEFSIARDMLMLFCIIFSFPLWLHLTHYFPMERRELLQRKWLLYGSYILAAIFLVLIILFHGEIYFITALLGLAFYNILLPLFFRKERSLESIKLSRVITRTGLLVFAIVVVFIAVLFYFSATPTPESPGIASDFFQGFIGIPLVLIPLAFLFTIGHYRLLDLDIRVRRNIQYNIVSWIWGVALLAVLVKLLFMLPETNFNLPNVQFTGKFIEFSDQPLDPTERVKMEKVVIMLLAVGLTWFAWRLQARGQKFVDSKFDRGAYDYRRAAGELAEVMGSEFTMQGLAKAIVKKLSTLMQVKQVGVLFFRGEKECCCKEAYGVDEDSWENFSTIINERIIKLIQRYRSDYRFSAEYLPNDIRDIFFDEGFRHIIAIRSKEKLVGVLLIGEKRSESPFHKDDLVFLAAVAKQASVAIENAFLYEELAEQERLKHELDIARRIQLASLPQTTPVVEGLEIAGISIPAQEVGGDYFDYLNGVANEITIIVGDVSGKGTSAALYMSKVQGIMRSLNDFKLSPRDLFIRANHLLVNDIEKQSFFTALGANFISAKQQMRLARAGHSPLFYYEARTNVVHSITPKGMGIGLTGSPKFASELEEQNMNYDKGDIFLFITDGITEAHNPRGDEFGDEKVLELLQNTNGVSAKRIRDQMITAVNHFAGNARQHDDLTVVVVKAV